MIKNNISGIAFNTINPFGYGATPSRPYQSLDPETQQHTKPRKKTIFCKKEKIYKFLPNNNENQEVIVVVDGFGVPKGTRGKVKDINFPYATISLDNSKEIQMRTISLMWMKDYLAIEKKLEKGLICCKYNYSDGNENLIIIETLLKGKAVR